MIAKVWYYVSMVFKKQGNTDTLSLYVMSLDEATACAENCVCPDAVSVDEREPAGELMQYWIVLHRKLFIYIYI